MKWRRSIQNVKFYILLRKNPPVYHWTIVLLHSTKLGCYIDSLISVDYHLQNSVVIHNYYSILFFYRRRLPSYDFFRKPLSVCKRFSAYCVTKVHKTLFSPWNPHLKLPHSCWKLYITWLNFWRWDSGRIFCQLQIAHFHIFLRYSRYKRRFSIPLWNRKILLKSMLIYASAFYFNSIERIQIARFIQGIIYWSM